MNDIISRRAAHVEVSKLRQLAWQSSTVDQRAERLVVVELDAVHLALERLPAVVPTAQIWIAADICDEVVGHHCEFKCSHCQEEIEELRANAVFGFCPFCGAALITDKEG